MNQKIVSIQLARRDDRWVSERTLNGSDVPAFVLARWSRKPDREGFVTARIVDVRHTPHGDIRELELL